MLIATSIMTRNHAGLGHSFFWLFTLDLRSLPLSIFLGAIADILIAGSAICHTLFQDSCAKHSSRNFRWSSLSNVPWSSKHLDFISSSSWPQCQPPPYSTSAVSACSHHPQLVDFSRKQHGTQEFLAPRIWLASRGKLRPCESLSINFSFLFFTTSNDHPVCWTDVLQSNQIKI